MSVGLCWIPQYWNEGPYVWHLLHVMIQSISLISIVDETSGSRLYGRGPTGHYLCNIARYKPDLASHGIENLSGNSICYFPIPSIRDVDCSLVETSSLQ